MWHRWPPPHVCVHTISNANAQPFNPHRYCSDPRYSRGGTTGVTRYVGPKFRISLSLGGCQLKFNASIDKVTEELVLRRELVCAGPSLTVSTVRR